MNTGKRKFASNLMAIIWFIIYLMPVMTFGFYSLGNIGDNKLYKDDIFSVSSPSVVVETGDVLSSPPILNPSFIPTEVLTDSQLMDFFGVELFQMLLGNVGCHPYITIDGVSYYYLFLPSEDPNVPLSFLFTSYTSEFFEYEVESVLFLLTITGVGPYFIDIFHGQTISFVGTVEYVLPNLLYTESIFTPSFMDKTFAQFGYDSNNLDIVAQSIVDFGDLVNFNGLTAISPATFFIWWFFLVTIVRLLFECVAFLPKLAVKWLHYFSRE